MPTPFDALTLDDVVKKIGEVKSDIAEASRLFYDGDHWQGAEGWIGPRPDPGDVGSDATLLLIEDAFTSDNAIAEVVDRHVAGALGRTPAWSMVRRERPEDVDDAAAETEETEAEDALAAEVHGALAEWWDARRVNEWMKKVATNLLLEERGAMRLYVPSSRLAAGDVVSATTLREALSHVYIDVPTPEQAMVYTDPATQQQVGLYAYEMDGKKGGEIVYVDLPKGRPPAEGEAVQTIIKTFGPDGMKPYPLPFGGRLTINEIRGRALISPQVQQNQKALNLATSMMPRNVVTGGFLERIIMNAQTPGEWEDVVDADGAVVGKRFVPGQWRTGAGTSQFLQGTSYTDEQGTTRIATPSVQFREPVDVSMSAKAAAFHYHAILKNTFQLHVLANGEVDVSGISREQARADFEKSLSASIELLDSLGRWMLETALAMGEAFMSKPAAYTGPLRATFECHADTGPVSPEERMSNTSAAKDGFLSRVTAMSRNGVADPEAEQQRIADQPDARIALAERAGSALMALTGAGVTLEGAARFIGLSEDDIRLLLSGMTDAEEEGGDDEGGAVDEGGATDKTGDEGEGSGGGAGSNGASAASRENTVLA